MEEYLNELVTITHIKNAISSTYGCTDVSSVYHECMELINAIEEEVIIKLTTQNTNK